MIRDILYRKPGKVRPMVEKFVAMAKLGEKNGMGRMRVYTDVSAEQYWTVVSEIEVESLERFMSMGPEAGAGTGARPVPATTGVAVPCARRSASRAKRGAARGDEPPTDGEGQVGCEAPGPAPSLDPPRVAV